MTGRDVDDLCDGFSVRGGVPFALIVAVVVVCAAFALLAFLLGGAS